MLHPSNAEVQEVFDKFPADYLQTDAEDFASLNFARRMLSPQSFTVIFQDFDPSDIDPHVLSLFEGKNSGVGELVNTSRAMEVALHAPIILAGGLNTKKCGKFCCRPSNLKVLMLVRVLKVT